MKDGRKIQKSCFYAVKQQNNLRGSTSNTYLDVMKNNEQYVEEHNAI